MKESLLAGTTHRYLFKASLAAGVLGVRGNDTDQLQGPALNHL